MESTTKFDGLHLGQLGKSKIGVESLWYLSREFAGILFIQIETQPLWG